MTNNGEAAETSYESIDDLKSDASFSFSNYTFVTDTLAQVTYDMSHMMEGYLVYAPASINKVIGAWLDVDTSGMPPTYTRNPHVFLLRLTDGMRVALQLTNYMDAMSVKGHMTVAYYIFEEGEAL